MSETLPPRADLQWYRKAAKKHLRSLRSKNSKATLADAQRAVAREHGFPSWPKLHKAIEAKSNGAAPAALIAAIQASDLAAIKKLLKASPALANARDEHGAPALSVAMERNDPKIVNALLDYGADASARYGRSAHTPLSWAMTIGSFKAADALLKAGVKTDLFCAAGLNEVETLKTFFDADGHAISGSSQTGSTRYDSSGNILPSPPADPIDLASDALYIASRNGRVEAVKFLLSQQVDLNFRAYMGGTPLHWAHFSGSKPVVKMLLNAGADPTARDNAMRATPRAFGICVPASWAHMKQLKKVLRADPKCVNLMEARGAALHEAARYGHIGIAKTLLKAGADKTIRDVDGAIPADVAKAAGHAELAELLKPAATPDASDPFIASLPVHRKTHKIVQWKPIMDAAFAGDAARIRKLLAAGADPNVISTTPARYRPLHRAIERKKSTPKTVKHEEAVKALLDGGADPHLRGGYSNVTALEMSAIGDLRFVPLLRDRFEPFDIFHAAALADEKRVTALLKQDKSLARASDETGWTPLHFAAASSLHTEPSGAAALIRIAKALLAAGADVSAAWNYEGHWPLRPMYYAAGYSNFPEMVELLLKAGGDPCDNESIYHASDEGHDACLALFEQHVPKKKLADECTICLRTQMHWNHSKGAPWLLEHGADPNSLYPKSGFSALHSAVARGAGETVIELLLKHGADPGIRNGAGESALAMARKAKKSRIVAQLSAATG